MYKSAATNSQANAAAMYGAGAPYMTTHAAHMLPGQQHLIQSQIGQAQVWVYCRSNFHFCWLTLTVNCESFAVTQNLMSVINLLNLRYETLTGNLISYLDEKTFKNCFILCYKRSTDLDKYLLQHYNGDNQILLNRKMCRLNLPKSKIQKPLSSSLTNGCVLFKNFEFG